MTVVVVGAGPAGAELAYQVLPGDYRSVPTAAAMILLVEAGPHWKGSVAALRTST